MDRAKQDTLLGLVFFAGLALLLYATYTLTSLWGTPDERSFYFSNASGLRGGDPVFVLGTRVGEVKEVNYLPGNTPPTRIEVVVMLEQPIALREDKRVRIRNSTLLGGKMVDIDPGTGAELAEGIVVEGEVATTVIDDLLENDDVKDIVDGAKQFIDTLNNKDGLAYMLFADDEFAQKIDDGVNSLVRSIEAIEKGDGTLRKLIHERETAERLDTILANTSEFTGSLNDPSKGLVGRLTNDPELNTKLDNFIDRFERFADALNDLENGGLVARLVHDPELGRKADEIVDDVHEVTTDLTEEHGLLGRLISDPQMGEQFSRILDQVSRAIEDAREAAPVGTFVQVLSGAF